MYGKRTACALGLMLTMAPAPGQESTGRENGLGADFDLEFALGLENGPAVALDDEGWRREPSASESRWREDDRLQGRDLEVSPFAGIRLRWRY